jgi:hypothetical protein
VIHFLTYRWRLSLQIVQRLQLWFDWALFLGGDDDHTGNSSLVAQDAVRECLCLLHRRTDQIAQRVLQQRNVSLDDWVAVGQAVKLFVGQAQVALSDLDDGVVRRRVVVGHADLVERRDAVFHLRQRQILAHFHQNRVVLAEELPAACKWTTKRVRIKFFSVLRSIKHHRRTDIWRLQREKLEK